jgi:hypothetical protein
MSVVSQEMGAEATTIKRISRSVSMLLCNSCYWCATALQGVDDYTCPACNTLVELIPLNEGEMFTYDHDTKKGIVLEFKRATR